MKKILVLGVLGIILWLMVQFPHIMLSPGELVAGHQDSREKCLSCHEPFWGISNDKCIACHKLSDIGRDRPAGSDSTGAGRKVLFHDQLAAYQCTMCHTDHKGVNPGAALTTFTHGLLAERVINNCAGCHNKPSDQLHTPLSPSCKNCHTTDGWKPAVRFDHDMIQGAAVNDCAGCHQKPDDAYHHLFTGNCSACHSTGRWKPSTFDHSTYFFLDRNHNASCNICHPNSNFGAYTCYGCHEHSESRIRAEHNEEGIYNVTDCVSCHKSGSGHDMEGGGESNREGREGYGRSQKREERNGQGREKERDDD